MYVAQFGVNGYSVVDELQGIELFTYATLAEAEAKAAQLNNLSNNTRAPFVSVAPPGENKSKDDTDINQKSNQDNRNDTDNAVNTNNSTPVTRSITTDPTSTLSTATPKTSSGSNFLRQFNPLGDFSSYTYKISLYTFSSDKLKKFVDTGRFDKTDLKLLVQSGGINNKGVDSTRAKGFELDFYIDNLVIDTKLAGKDQLAASNSVNFKFQVIEPYGMTFPTKLVLAQQEVESKSAFPRQVKDHAGALQGFFYLNFAFYGYDKDGKLVDSKKYNNVQNMDQQAAFERGWPVVIKKLTFKLDGKATVYNVECVQVNEQVAMGIKRGLVDPSITVSGDTVKEALGGFTGSKTGLVDLLNKQQEDQKENKQIKIPDVYAVKFDSTSGIDSSKIVEKDIVKDRTPLLKVKSIDDVNDRESSSAGASTMLNKRTITISSGTPIIQAIDQIICQSDYIKKAFTIEPKEEAQQVKDSEQDYDTNPGKTVSWYIVVPQTEVIGYDDIRNDFAYKITYFIKKYEVPYVRSTNIAYIPKYPGPHKKYNYWYTGKNSEVLSYEQDYNLLYFNASALTSEGPVTNLKDSAPNKPKGAQPIDDKGAISGTFDIVNTVKTFLYSPGDQLNARIKILGDPDFLMPASAGDTPSLLKKLYGNDFSINPNSGQVFIEVFFQQVEDYDEKGLLTPNGNIDFWDFSKTSDLRQLVKGMVYMITEVISTFSKGQFTQDFKVAIPNFDELSGSVSGNTNASTTNQDQRENQSDAETNRLARQESQAAGLAADKNKSTVSQDTNNNVPSEPTYADYDIPVDSANDDAQLPRQTTVSYSDADGREENSNYNWET